MNQSIGVHLQAFFKDPKEVAALLPTSSAAVERIASKVNPERAGLIVEYGPGSGVLTRRLLERLPSEGRLVAIEVNADLATGLRARIDDPRLTVVRDSAQCVLDILEGEELGPVDYVLSGIPFFWFDPETALSIVANTHAALTDGGSFVTYQMFYQARRFLRTHLDRCFSEVRCDVDLRNLPPYRICEAVK